jgi:predicted transcriptional regulator
MHSEPFETSPTAARAPPGNFSERHARWIKAVEDGLAAEEAGRRLDAEAGARRQPGLSR